MLIDDNKNIHSFINKWILFREYCVLSKIQISIKETSSTINYLQNLEVPLLVLEFHSFASSKKETSLRHYWFFSLIFSKS